MKRIVFMMSDTGYGHRAAAEAISAALSIRYGDAVQCDIVDVFKYYTPFPFRNFPQYYPDIIKHSSRLYSMSYNFSNTPRRARLLSRALHAVSYPAIRHLPQDYSPDAIVSTHSIITSPSLSAFSHMKKRPVFITVVVDLISTHMFWYDKRSDLLLLPTEAAYDQGIRAGIHPERMHITGIPVHPKFSRDKIDKVQSRKNLDWDPTMPTALLVGGGDGMGHLYDIAQEINKSEIPCQLAIITGRNSTLRTSLEKLKWKYPTHIYGFVDNIYELMSAADLLITKAGSLTISEACVMGIPMIVYAALPGQEEGNLQYVVDSKMGIYAPSARTVVKRIRQLLVEDNTLRFQYAQNALMKGQPDAVWEIAESIWNQI